MPAIVVTGSTMTGHDKEAQAHDFHLLIKPVVPNKLRAMIAFKLPCRLVPTTPALAALYTHGHRSRVDYSSFLPSRPTIIINHQLHAPFQDHQFRVMRFPAANILTLKTT